MTTYSQMGTDGNNDGWLLALMSFACEEFGWHLDYVLDEASVLMLLLLLRQKAINEGKHMMSIADKEKIDANDWDIVVKQNRERLRKQMKTEA